MRPLSLLTAAVLSLPASTMAAQGATQRDLYVEVRTKEYAIAGATAAELNVEIERAGPRSHGKVWAGHTGSDLRWTWRSLPRGEECAMEEVRVRLLVDVTLPRWDPPPAAALALVSRWGEYMDALRLHEDGHVALARQEAEAVHDSLLAVRTPSCDGSDEAADAVAARLRERFRARQEEYDRETGHGRTQGAVRPRDSVRATPPEAASAEDEEDHAAVALMVAGALLLGFYLVRGRRR